VGWFYKHLVSDTNLYVATADVGGAPYVRYWWVDSGGSREFFSRFGRAPYPHIWVTGSGRAVAINVDKAFAGVGVGLGLYLFLKVLDRFPLKSLLETSGLK